MATFIQKETLSTTGSAAEYAITLDRGTKQFVRRIDIIYPNVSNDDYIQVLRKDSATTANERTSSHADSVGVLVMEGYINSGVLDVDHAKQDVDNQDRVSAGLRVYLGGTLTAGTVYLNIVYDYEQ